MRWMVWCWLALAACGNDATRIELVVHSDSALGLESYRISIGDFEAQSDALPAIELELPDDLGDEDAELRVWGIRGGEQVAYGATIVTPILEETITVEITLSAVLCPVSCIEGELSCDQDGIVECVQDGAGCTIWTAPIACPVGAPFCSNGVCGTTCSDECSAGATRCAGSLAVETCGEFDSDTCSDWGDASPCNQAPPSTTCASASVLRTFSPGATCSAGACSFSQVDRTCIGGCTGARCTGGWGTFVQSNAPSARYGHSAVWTGTRMIIWGGATSTTQPGNSGASYDVATGQWTPISATNAPSARRDHTAVWTGTEMIVWGGTAISNGAGIPDGGRYNPATDSWTALPSTGAPTGRFGHSAIWTGSEMIIWGGGLSTTSSIATGARFDPATGVWTAISNVNAPGARRDHSAVWTGDEMIVWGGSAIVAGMVYADGKIYDPATDMWTPLVTTTPPNLRFAHAAVWTGTEMIVWGGADSSTGTYGDGKWLDLDTGVWTALPTVGQPGAHRDQSAVWTGSEMVMWGGSTILDGGSVIGTGFTFDVYQ